MEWLRVHPHTAPTAEKPKLEWGDLDGVEQSAHMLLKAIRRFIDEDGQTYDPALYVAMWMRDMHRQLHETGKAHEDDLAAGTEVPA